MTAFEMWKPPAVLVTFVMLDDDDADEDDGRDH